MNRREFNQLIAATAFAQVLSGRAGRAQTIASSGFRFSVMLWTLERQAPFDRCIEIVAAAGYHGIELVREFEKWSASDTRRVNAKMRSLGLVFDAIVGGKFTLADPAALSLLRERLPTRIAFARDIGCTQLLLTSGRRVDGLSQDTQRSTMVNNLKQVVDLTYKHNIQVVIEPIDLLEDPHAYLNSVTDGFEIVKSVGSPNLKVLYDVYHEQRAAGNLIEKIEKNIDWIGLVHIADVPGRGAPGTGEINYTNIYRKLAELKYNKFIAMEFYPAGDPVDALKTARQAAERAEQVT